jgi:sigma-B regulation protein RsbU (phosphoserine phosphatase)
MRRLLADFDEVFDLDHEVGSARLGDLVERAVTGLDAPSQNWGTEGQREQVVSEGGRFVSFHYRPHLFPGMDTKLRLAHEMQFKLLPQQLPENSPVSISAVLESYCHLSGDLFGWETLRDGKFLLWIVDMAGHGLRAGLASAVLRILIDHLEERSHVERLATELNRTLNGCIRAKHDNLYATGFFMALDPDGRWSYTSAGHPSMMIRRADGTIEELPSTNPPLGLFGHTAYDTSSGRLETDDGLLLFTDGLVEATGHDGEEFGIERLRGIFEDKGGSPRGLTSSVYGTLTERQDINKLDDDVTFLAAQRVPN